MRLLRIVVVLVGLAASSVAAAPGIQLSIANGRVWLVTDGATVGQILAEWARVGGTRIINGDRLTGGPLTLEMRGVPELQALEIVMRPTGGFVAAARTPGAATVPPSLSRFERIVVLPPLAARLADSALSASAAAPPPEPPALAPPAPIFNASGARRLIGPDGEPVPDDQDGAPPSPSPLPPPRRP